MAITIYQLAIHRGVKVEDGCVNGSEFERVGLPMLGGCYECGATVGAGNACPSKEGYLKCASGCIGNDGFATCEEAEAFIEGSEPVPSPEDSED